MNRHQKIALYNLIVVIVTLVVLSITVGLLARQYGFPRAYGGSGALGLLGLLGFSNHIFRKKAGEVDTDERDQLIQKKAMSTAFKVFWIVWIAGSLMAFSLIGPEKYIPAVILPLMVWAGFIVFILGQPVTVLVQYGWGDKSNE